jgi:hypothetical protein
VDVYPCPACGGVAAAPTGCRRCGRAHDPQAAALAELNRRLAGLDELERRLAGLDEQTRALVADQSRIDAERARLQAEAEALRTALRRQLAIEAGLATPAPRTSDESIPADQTAQPARAEATVSAAAATAAPPARASAETSAGPGASPATDTTDGLASDAPAPEPRSPDAEAPQTSTHEPEAPEPTPPTADQTTGPRATGEGSTGGVPRQRTRPDPTVETSRGSARNTLLTLGGVLLALAAVVVTGLFFTAAPTGGRAAILAVATLVALSVPLLLARRTLTATAETLAGFGLLMVLLDGYVAYSTNLLGLGSASLTLYSSVLCGVVAAVAAGYRLASHLRAPQYAALLAVQPVLPLFAAHLSAGREAMAAVFAVVAALNLGSVEVLGRDPGRVLAAVLRRLSPASRSRPLALPGLAPGPDGQVWPRRLRETAWALFGATLATSVGLGVIGLVTARTDAEAFRSALVLILAAAVGVAGGLLARRPPLGQVAGGAATFLTVMAANRVNALAVPEHALVLTVGIAVVIAVGCRALPRRARPGPRWGSLAGAGFTGIIVAIEVVRTTVAIVRASVTPRVWAADVAAFGERVPAVEAQIPATAVLLVLLAVAAVPRRWRGDAFVAGLGVLALALPPWLFRSASLAWLLVPVVAWAVSSLAVASAVPARRGASAAIRAGTAGVLCLFAVAVSLAGPGLTALTCALVAIIAVGTAVGVGLGRGPLGPYAERVADAALGAGAGALPVAVGTATWLVGAPGSVLVPVTLLATAAGVETAMLAQAAAVARARARQASLVDGQGPGRPAGAPGGGVTSPAAGHGGTTPPATLPASRYRSGSAAGALGAATGALLLALRVEGATPADIAVAGLLATAAVVAVTGRPSVDPLPRDRRGRPTSPWRDSAALAAALATAGLVLAVARLGAVILPGGGLVLTTAAVLAAGLGVVALRRAWRPGPRLGTAAAGAGVVTVTAAIAVVEAANAVAASIPWWHADLAAWPQRAASIAPYGAAVPVSLLLAGLAALVLLPRPANIDTFLILASLAALAVPAIVAAPWWSAPVIACTLTTVAGLTAALVRRGDPPGTAWRRLALAGGLALYAVAVGSATPAGSGAVLTALLGSGTVVAAVAATRPWVPTPVPGLATALALAAAPAAAACVAATFGTGRAATLGIALGACALAVVAVVGLRLAGASWDGYPGTGVGVAALTIAIAAAVSDLATGATIAGAHPTDAPVWAAACALLATVGAGHSRPMPASWRAAAPRLFGGRREPTAFDADDDDESRPGAMVATLAAIAVPLGVFAAAVSTPAWVTALIGPFQTLDHVWSGDAALPEARGAATALGTLLLLAPTSGGIAVILGGRRYVLAAVLPPLAAAAVVLPEALGASPRAVPWVALAVALAAGLGAALSRPSLPVAATWLRATAGVVCALTGAAGLAGSLSTRASTLAALGVLAAGGLAAALLGRDPVVRAVAWVVAGACGLALPVTAAAAAGTALRSAVFGMLTACAVLVLLAWGLARRERYGDATVAETIATLGALTAVAMAYGSVRHLAAVLTICGLLLGMAALRTDREPERRMWLVRMAIVTELVACWLLLYGAHVGFAEAYTLPFAVAALLAGVIEQRRRPHLSSWVVYGPALAGAFLPSVTLILVGEDPPWRWVSVFLGAVAIVIVGSWRGWRAPVVTGATIAVGVAIVEMVWLLIEGQIAGAFLVGLAGVTLIVFGAFAERSLRRAR